MPSSLLVHNTIRSVGDFPLHHIHLGRDELFFSLIVAWAVDSDIFISLASLNFPFCLPTFCQSCITWISWFFLIGYACRSRLSVASQSILLNVLKCQPFFTCSNWAIPLHFLIVGYISSTSEPPVQPVFSISLSWLRKVSFGSLVPLDVVVLPMLMSLSKYSTVYFFYWMDHGLFLLYCLYDLHGLLSIWILPISGLFLQFIQVSYVHLLFILT